MNDLFNLIFGCRHERRSWPRSRDLKGRPVPTYEACLICGAHLPWKGLREDRQTARQAGETAECCDA